MADRLDLAPRYREELEELLREHVPEVEVWAYGSRVNGRSHDASDLDLVLRSPALERVGPEFYDLIEALEHSDIPIHVDVHDWARLPESFYSEIERGYVVVQPGVSDGLTNAPRADWQDVAIGEIAEIIGGGTPSTKVPDNFGGDVPWLTPKDLSGVHERYVARGERNLSQRGLDSSSAKLVPPGSVLLSTRAPVGYVALAKNAIATNQGFRNLVVGDMADPEYLYYWLKLNTAELERHASGTTFRELSGSSLKKIRLRLPPLEEQRAIAGVLGALDDKIELNRRMNETLEAMARTLFKSWFVDFDPVRAKANGQPSGLPPELDVLFSASFEDSELGPIPTDWRVGVLEDAVTQLREKQNPLKTPETLFSHFSIPAYDDGQMPRREFGESIKSVKSRVAPDSVLLSKMNPEIERVWLPDVFSDDEAICSTEFLVLAAQRPFRRSYIYCLARSAAFRRSMESLVTGTSKSHQRARSDAVVALPMVIPPAAVVEALDLQIEPALRKVLRNRREIAMLADVRDALLPRLLSGGLRVTLGGSVGT